MIAVAATVVFAAAGSAVILLPLKAVMGLRVTRQEERAALDLSQHSESAYVFESDYDALIPTPTSQESPAGAEMRSQIV